MMTKPFRWTKQHKIIRILLNAGQTKDDIMNLARRGTKGQRASECAMTLADWSMAIDRVQERLVSPA